MPFPLLPLIAIGVSTSLAVFSLKRALGAKQKASANERKNVFSKYAVDHRIKEKTAQSLHLLAAIKTEANEREIFRFQQIFENIMHSDLNFERPIVEVFDYRPFLNSAPVKVVDSLGRTSEWLKLVLVDIQKELRKANLGLQQVVLHHGLDFRKYGPKEKAITIQAFSSAQTLSQALSITLVNGQGKMRVEASDEIEDLMIEHHQQVA